ncbi:MAG TPA: photosystem I reaction center protein subunit XI [Phormidium sp.]
MADPRDAEVVKAFNGDPFLGNLSTPINDSAFTKTFINNLPAYRKGLSPIIRGLEIGMAHGYFIVGPWIKLGPLRDYGEAANLGGLISGLALILIATACMSVYGLASFQENVSTVPSQNPQAPAQLKTAEGWSQLTAGFFVGAMGGAFVAFFLLENFNLVDAIFRGVVHH